MPFNFDEEFEDAQNEHLFSDYMRDIEQILFQTYLVSINDLVDCDFRSMFEDGISAQEAVDIMIDESSM